jgi:hypothetical protein
MTLDDYIVCYGLLTLTVILIGLSAWLGLKKVPCLQDEVAKLTSMLNKATNPPPVVYNKWTNSVGNEEQVPLGTMSPEWYRNLSEPGIEGKVAAAGAILADASNKHKFSIVLTTNKGIFVRTIEQDDKNVLTKSQGSFELKMTWKPIHFGQPVRVYKTLIVYKDQIMNDEARLRDLVMCAGDVLNLDYTFNSLR